jgi:uncharacterized protein
MGDIPSGQPAVRVEIDGREVSSAVYGDLTRVAVSDDDRGTSSFELGLITWSKEGLELSWVDDPLFAPGRRVTIAMGYVGAMRTIMVGELTSLDLDLSARDVPSLTARGYDLSHRMSRATTTRAFVEASDAAIAKKIAGQYALGFEGPPATAKAVSHPVVMQYNQTDLEFLQERARLLGYEVKVDADKLVFRPRRSDRPKAVKLSAESDLLSFNASLSLKDLVDAVEVYGWDQGKKAVIKAASAVGKLEADDGTIGGAQARKAFKAAKVMVVDAFVTSEDEAAQLAHGRLEELTSGFVHASCTCFGNTALRAGIEVEIEGVGERFGGPYDVQRTSHAYDAMSSTYRTSLTLRRNAT